MLRLSAEHRGELITLARAAFPKEACGLLAGEIWGEEKIVRAVFSLKNTDERPGYFTMSSKEQCTIITGIQEKGLSLLGNFHSHPIAPARPSDEDIRLAYDPSLSYVIISLQGKKPSLKSFTIQEGTVWEEIQRDLPAVKPLPEKSPR